MHVVGKARRWMKMTIHVVSVEMAVNYFAVTIAHQHIMKLACLPRYLASLYSAIVSNLNMFQTFNEDVMVHYCCAVLFQKMCL